MRAKPKKQPRGNLPLSRPFGPTEPERSASSTGQENSVGAIRRGIRRTLQRPGPTGQADAPDGRADASQTDGKSKRRTCRESYDGHTLPDVLEQCWTITKTCPSVAICDRGYRGLKQVGDTRILIPGRPKKKDSRYKRLKARQRFRRRAAIEPVIGHLKHDHRMARSYLKGAVGDAINLFMAAAAFNFRKWIRKLEGLFALLAFYLECMDSRQRFVVSAG